MSGDAGHALTVPSLIARKRDGHELDEGDIRRLVEGFTRGEVADYQMSALAMAIFLRGMNERETAALTLAMRDSGKVLDLDAIPGHKVDKHSTGGVGDKVSLCLAPVVAACGVKVPMISGRGLGHTGGTLDKLEAIEGFRVDLTTDEFAAQVRDVGAAIIGQTEDLAPADKRLYALRDVTGTVESIPLITASILSKKLAEGIDALVLDVKVGRGAFMKTEDSARELARSIVRVGQLAGKKVTAVLTDMEAPLGRAVGNGIETAEAFEVLHGGGPADLVECTMALGAEMLILADAARTPEQARERLQAAIDDGAALRTMKTMVEAQGGDPRAVQEPDRLPRAPTVTPVPSEHAGHVTAIDALEIGLASASLGAGRTRADQTVDPAVGVVLDRKPGDEVQVGEPLAHVHARSDGAARQVAARIAEAFTVRGQPPAERPLVVDTIRG